MTDNERVLASVRYVDEVRPIEDADLIELVIIDGWQVVTQKSNRFAVNDLCIFFEIDSVLPETEVFEFLRPCYVSERQSVNGAGFRLKTRRMRGEISQGLVMPLTEFFETCDIYGSTHVRSEKYFGTEKLIEVFDGYDLTGILGVVKYEKPIPQHLFGYARGNFPDFIPKTNQARIQNVWKRNKKRFYDRRWEVTLKLDGSSATYYVKDGVFGVCSRNLDLQETEGNAYWTMARKLGLEEKMLGLGRNIAIQGELMGPSIQGNREKLPDLQFYLFDVWDIDNDRYFTHQERMSLATTLAVHHAPLINIDYQIPRYVDVLTLADIPSMNHKIAEGVVFKSMDEGPQESFKIISNRFLLKCEE